MYCAVVGVQSPEERLGDRRWDIDAQIVLRSSLTNLRTSYDSGEPSYEIPTKADGDGGKGMCGLPAIYEP